MSLDKSEILKVSYRDEVLHRKGLTIYGEENDLKVQSTWQGRRSET